MKYSTLSFIISSSILLHACGSSNDIQNHTSDPKPNHNSQHQSNSHNINGNQSSNNSNQAANTSHNSNQQNNQNDFTPNISSGNAPNPKNNIIISSNNHQNDDDDDNDIDMNIDLDQLTLEQANALVNAADKEFNDADAALRLAETEKAGLENALKKIKESLDKAVEAIQQETDKTKLPHLQELLANDQELYKKTAEQLSKVEAKNIEETAKKSLAANKQALANNAKKYVEEKAIDPEAVLKATAAKHKEHQAQIEKDKLQKKQDKLNAEAKDLEVQIAALKAVQTEIEKITADGKTEEAKTDATDRIAKIKEDIAKLEKAKTEKTEKANNLEVPIKQADVVVSSEKEKVDAAVKAAAYRGVYASDGKYDPSTSYKNVKKVVAANPSPDKSGHSKPDEWMQEWTLFIKDGDKEVKIDTSELGGELKLGKKPNPVARFDVSKDILASQAGVYFVQGRIGNNFFNAGLVTPEDKIPKDEVKYENTSISANKAFLKTSSNLEVIADVEAKADFGKKTFEGKFSGFKEYTIKTTDGHIGSGNGGITDTEIKFKADIKGNKFVPVTNPEKNAANVYGYFYGEGAKEAGGLVDHPQFHGTFGVRAK